MKAITYYLNPASPWTYLGHERLAAIAARHGATIDVRPIDLGQVFPVSGGLPLGQRPVQRRAYRLVDLNRWATFLGLPINLNPKFFPVAAVDASRLIIVAKERAGQAGAMRLAGALLKGVWVDERNIADHGELAAIADASGFDGAALVASLAQADALHAQYTREAIDAQVFGVPWYVFRGEPFWGQDRLEFLERAVAA